MLPNLDTSGSGKSWLITSVGAVLAARAGGLPAKLNASARLRQPSRAASRWSLLIVGIDIGVLSGDAYDRPPMPAIDPSAASSKSHCVS